MLVTHACTFIRVERKTSRRREYSVVLLLDSNYPKPQCNNPLKLVEDSTRLDWRTHFEAYKEASLFQLHYFQAHDSKLHASRLLFPKNII